MKIAKEILKELVYGSFEGFEVISDEITDTGRWSVYHEMIFSHEGHFYRTSYSVGATEYQCEEPFEFDPVEVDVEEVFPVEKVITVYMSKEQIEKS